MSKRETEIPDSAVIVTRADSVDIPAWEMPTEPSWDRARDLVAQVKQSITAIVLLGMEIEALKDQHFNAGHGGPRPGAGRPGNQAAARGRLISDDDFPRMPPRSVDRRQGWQIKVQEELGITRQAAERIVEKSRYLCMIQDITRGELVEYTDSRHKIVEVNPTPEMQQLALNLMGDVAAGAVNPQRAWAGLVGEGMRSASGGGNHRSPIDHCKNLKQALIKLRTSIKAWRHIDGEARLEIEALWADVAANLPDTWIA